LDRTRLSGAFAGTPDIESSLKKTGILVALLSTGYFKSDWCPKEREAFLRHVVPSPSGVSRVFVVELDEVEEGQRPKEFAALLAHRFWAKGETDPFPRRLGEPNAADDAESLLKIDALARELKMALDQL